MSRQFSENPYKTTLMVKELDENNLMPFSPELLFLIAMFLDLTSLRNLIGTSVQMYQVLNEGSLLWKSILKSFGVVPENGKEGKEYKAKVKIFFDISASHEFFQNELNIKEDITFEESKALHVATVDARNALKKFSSDPRHFFKLFYKYVRTLYGTAGLKGRYPEKMLQSVKMLADKYGKVELESPEEAKLAMAKYCLVFVDLFRVFHDMDFPQIYSMVLNNFIQPLYMFCEKFTVGDYPSVKDVEKSDPIWVQAISVVHEGVGSVLDSLDPNEDDEELKKVREFYEVVNQQLQNGGPEFN